MAIWFLFGFCQFPDTCGQLRKTKIGWFEAELAVTGEKLFRLSQKERFLEPIKKNPYIVNYWWAGVRNYVWHYFGDHEDLYISSLFYFTFVIDNAKLTCFDCVNSNIYSCILSFLKLHRTFWVMNLMCCIYLVLTLFILMRYANLFYF